PGDHILVPSPSYPLFDFLADCNDVSLIRYPLLYDKGWTIDFDGLKNLIQPHMRVLMVVNPNNPTGSYLDIQSMRELIDLAQKHRLCLICDEVFFDYAYTDTSKKIQSFAAYSDVPLCVLNGLSKMLALPQLKASWMLIQGPDAFCDQAIERMEIISDTFLSVNTPVQVGMAGLLALRENIQKQILERLMCNRQFLTRQIQDFPACSYLHAEGGWYAMIRMPALMSDEDWAMVLLEQHGVYVHPGHYYHIHEGACLVLSLLTETHLFKEGVEIILDALQRRCH
ncbi:MAG: pyridoxal phosphate-dependent aminotransferase, partial [Chlamydiota bacterium]|nr:pyridoxal phosphate-dependent aminotransferase [Chlamydiota bacterium]